MKKNRLDDGSEVVTKCNQLKMQLIAREGGHVAGKARAEIEKQTGESVITGTRSHALPEKTVRRPIRKIKKVL